ncbi:alkylation response protein AidB-like acyl-CoA dehydrogenase [Pseudacidovorax sp. 1753]|uniref:acyl-CoA dehydrogenase family protein n=1 Tax=unclassified Pseudacidovorax TaxID=2620592 RepID=UPI001B776D91|nr:acyl-CoA dehydrogenase family protein [Pseudacidovorax sp.]MBP6895928.1 acyl-CoA dehydrogenase family protein [Pseudacidovorax sp.]
MLNSPAFEAEQRFRQEVRDYCENELPRNVRDKVQANLFLTKEDNLAFLRSLAPRGWVAGHWPREHGGAAWTPLQRFVFEEESMRCGAPWLIPFGVNYVGPVIYTFGSEAQKRRFLPPILSSQEWWAQGYSEPGAGSDLAGLKTRAVRRGDRYVVSGQKIWTSYVQWADWMFCLVRTSDEGRPQQGISFLLIDMRSPGVQVRPIRTMDGCHHVNEVFLDEVEVPVEMLVGEEGKGWSYAKFLLSNERILSAETGRATRQLQHLRALMAEAPSDAVRNLPVFERRLAELELRLHALRAFCLAYARTMDPAAPPGVEASIMKIRGTELQQAIAEATLDWLGAAAVVYDPLFVNADTLASPVGPATTPGAVREYLHGRASTIYGGSNEIQRNIISKAELGL